MKKKIYLFNKIESMILVFCILCFFALVMFQGLLKKDNSPVFQDYYQIESEFDYEQELRRDIGYIIFRLENEEFSDISILINGKDKYKFRGNSEIKLEVHNNDIIKVDSSMYDQNVNLKIVGISKNVMFPKLSTEISTNSGLNVVGNVILN